MPRGSLEISTYVASTAADAAVSDETGSWPPRRGARPSRIARAWASLIDRIPAALLGAGVSLLLHTFLIASVLWAAGMRQAHPPDHRLSGSARMHDADEGAMQWIVLDMSPGPSREASPHLAPVPLASVAPPRVMPAELARVTAELDANSTDPAVAGTSSSNAASTGDGAALLAMAGRYIGQIGARIDRAWLRPRTPIGAPRFSCRVRIDQDRAGEVLEITLEGCNGSARWQQSLVEAIESASPLPAPPDPAVFAPIVHMSFEASAYAPGAPAQEYEPVRLAQVAQAAASADSAPQALARLRDALDKARPNEVIKLTIVGPPGGDIERPPPEPSEPDGMLRDGHPP